MTTDRPLLGIFLMLCFCILAPFGDAIAKLLGDRVAIGQLLAVRFAIQAAILVPLIWVTGRSFRMSSRVFRLTALRTVLHIIGSGAMFLSLRYLPLADTIAIAFVLPFILLLLGWRILHEQVGPHRLAACAVGFVGTLLVIQPNFTSVGAPALLPLVVAVAFAFFMLVTRQIAKDCDPVTLQAVSGLLATAILIPLLLLAAGHDLPGLQVLPVVTGDIWLLAAIGIVGTCAHLLMTWSLRFAPSTTLAPMQYLEIPFATLFGWMIFSDLPNGLAALGIAITVGAGLYVIYRERVTALAPARPAPTPPVA